MVTQWDNKAKLEKLLRIMLVWQSLDEALKKFKIVLLKKYYGFSTTQSIACMAYAPQKNYLHLSMLLLN